MATVRETDGVDDHIFLGGSGGALNASGFGVMVVCRLMSLTGSQAIMAPVNAPSTTLGVLYYDATNEISFGSPSGDVSSTALTLNTTDVWLLGFTQTSGNAVTFHARNLTTGAAASHPAGGSTTIRNEAWTQTEIGSGDGGAFVGNKRFASAAVFTSPYSDANFESVTTSTAQINALSPSRLWDFNQASTGTAVVNLRSGSNDQAGIVGTTVVSDSAFDFWTFGLTPPVNTPSFQAIPLMGGH
jgi:hypothetical protein